MSESLRPVALIVGASSGVGRALAENCAKNGFDLILISRETLDLEAVASDCRIRHRINAKIIPLDLGAIGFHASQLLQWIREQGEGNCRVNYAFLVAGANSDADVGVPPEVTLLQMARVNFLAPAQIFCLLAAESETLGLKTVVACSSIAASVPRRRNLGYASAKAALTTFCLGLRHHFAFSASDVRVQIYCLGYVDTGLSFGQRLLFPVASPRQVAEKICQDLDKDIGAVFFPGYWRWIVFILRILPWSIYKRLKF